jgi:hypothetical protein
LIHRFLEDLRSRVVALEARNVDTSQLVSIPLPTTKGTKHVLVTTENESRTIGVDSTANGTVVRSPSVPGLFDVTIDRTSVLHGAASFQDTREADLSNAESFSVTEEQRNKNFPTSNPVGVHVVRYEPEGFTSILIVLTSLAILLGWLHSAPPEKRARNSRPQELP